MNPDFQRLMNNATRLTLAGDLQAATTAIQAAAAAACLPQQPQRPARRDRCRSARGA
ncbi:hypothetical protein LP414_26905 [Polaromonas sp. P1(28)-13]|nr:hypothetical protein LP414_26905 [Polaromonas sp. P1(28)-13]